MTLLLAAALLPAPPVCAPAGSDFQLELRPKRTWSIELPADPFRKVSGSIPVPHANGAGFTAEVRGVGLALDTDGDGEVDRVVEGREHPETKVRYARVDLAGHRGDGTPFTYPVRLEVRAEGWAWASSAVMEGSLDGTPIEVIDLDGNGRFGDVGADAVVVGGTDVAQFLGRTVSADGQLYRLDVAGQRVSFAPFDGDTGTLDLHGAFDGKGVLLSAVVKSVDGLESFEFSYAEEGLTVPVGSYYVVAATLGLGEARVVCDAGDMQAISVQSGEKAELAWGGPVKASFAYARKGSELVLDPSQVHYVGRAGERWVGWNPIGKSPTFHVKDAETGDVLVDAVFPGSC